MPNFSNLGDSAFVIEPLGSSHDRSGFVCGNDRIDHYFQNTVSQDVRRQYATCFVAKPADSNRVIAFYTLSSSNVPLADLPAPLARKLPRYPTVPAILIGWLARDTGYKGLGLGQAMLFDAIRTVATAPIGAHAIFADAIDDGAEFYRLHGFEPLLGRPMTFYLPMATALKVISPV